MPAALLVSKSPPLCGELTVHGAKNSVLPILAATLLCRTPCVLHNCPDILDVTHTLQILRHLGCSCERSGSTLSIDPRGFAENAVPPALAGSMRASSLFLGALLARTGAAALTLPGGCPIGARPIDYHLQAFRALGASAEEEGGTVRCRADRLHGARLRLPGPSVGATENAMLAALGADGCTTIENAACEPEIADLGAFLCACGADLRGAGTPRIEIEGGALTLRRAAPASCAGVIEVLGQCGCRIRCGHDTISIHRQGPLTACRPVTARPYPGFPTDAMPVLLAAQLGAQGKTSFTETIFENRFLYVQELQKLGAKLSQDGRTVRLQGAEPLHAARLHAGDLRGGAALVLGAMQAEGESTIFGVKHIQRGYDNLEAALQSAGARLKTVEIPIKV